VTATAPERKIILPSALPQQRPLLDSTAQFKIGNAGRRGGKSRAGLIAILLGHGKGKHSGLLRVPGPYFWLSPDYPRSVAIWREEIEPRFGGLREHNIILNQSERRLVVPEGSLDFMSAENVDAIRNRKIAGIVIDEAAWFDLEYAWTAVIMPALADLHGWALFLSTPNAGPDGNELKRLPSYFNQMCESILRKERGPEWAMFTWKTNANPKLDATTLAELRAEYPLDSPTARQEFDAELLVSGTGLVFTEWNPALHILKSFTPPPGWDFACGLDWGYRAPSWFGLFACGPDGDVVCIEELYFRDVVALNAGRAVGQLLRRFGHQVDYIAGDEQMWYKTGISAPTIAEEFQNGVWEAFGGRIEHAPRLIEATHGRGSRLTKLQVMHRYMMWKPEKDNTVKPWNMPRLRFTAACKHAIRTIPALPYDAKKTEDVDTAAEDHPYDGVTAFLMSRPPLPEKKIKPAHPEKHEGFVGKRRRQRWKEALREASEPDVETRNPLQGFRMPRNFKPLEPEDLE
jgi:hypothetical protein